MNSKLAEKDGTKAYGIYDYGYVTSYTSLQCIENNDVMPGADTLPSLIGSGMLYVPIDASGQQLLDCLLPSDVWGPAAFAEHASTYTYSESMYNTFFDSLRQAEIFPLGFFSYQITLDGVVYSSENIMAVSTNWSRTTSLVGNKVLTNFTLDGKVAVEIEVFVPYGSVTPVHFYRFTSVDTAAHSLIIQPSFQIASRQGQSFVSNILEDFQDELILYSRRSVTAGDPAAFFPHEDYNLTFGVSIQNSETAVLTSSVNHVGVTVTSPVGAGASTEFTVMFYIGSNKTNTDSAQSASAALNEFSASSYASYKDAAERDWQSYYDRMASIDFGNMDTLDPRRFEKEFVYNTSLCLNRACQPSTDKAAFHNSYCLGHDTNWQNANFWDSGFITEGVILSGNLDAAKNYVSWQNSVLRQQGRPFNWQLLDDGTNVSIAESSTWLADATFALAAIKTYEASKDTTSLASIGWATIKATAEWAASNCFDAYVYETRTIYKLKDSTFDSEYPLNYYNNLFTILYLLAVMKKALEYSELNTWALDATVAEVVQNVSLPQGYNFDSGRYSYYGCDKWNYNQYSGNPDQTVKPMDVMPNGVDFGASGLTLSGLTDNVVIDSKIFNSTIGLDGAQSYYVGGYDQADPGKWVNYEMPWTGFWTVTTLRRIGISRSNDAWRLMNKYFENHKNYIFGPGYFCEISGPLAGHCGTIPPYATTSNAYISNALETFVYSNIWSNDIGILTMLPLSLQNNTLSAVNVHSSNGLTASVNYSPSQTSAALANFTAAQNIDRTIMMLMPLGVATADIVVTKDGAVLTLGVDYFIDSQTEYARTVRIPNVVVNQENVVLVVSGNPIIAEAPIPPTILGLLPGSGMVNVEWTPVGGALMYEIQRSDNSQSGPFTTIDTVSDCTFVDRTMPFGNEFYYRINAVGDFGTSSSAVAGPVRLNFSTTFGGETVGQPPAGGGWQVVSGNWAVNDTDSTNQESTMVDSSNPDPGIFNIMTTGDSQWENYTAVTKFKFQNTANRVAALMVRYQDEANFYRLFVLENSIGLQEFIGGEWQNPAATANFIPETNTWYWLKIEVNGSDIRAKIWLGDGSTVEPSGWTVETSFPSFAQGKIGLGSYETEASFTKVIVVTQAFEIGL